MYVTIETKQGETVETVRFDQAAQRIDALADRSIGHRALRWARANPRRRCYVQAASWSVWRHTRNTQGFIVTVHA